ncbi:MULTISPECIES: thioredoxin fold domain-containing protein [unclassified Sphingobacterium]|uniref:thioredoxin fold domain-containing protein n=1 Tax=unclassified Sphingobacterium TaxID=2609468 RepID=UPI0025D9E25A|nr:MULTISPECIES: thioredoxin fold domain-containing protein [unclassified Sphingobacterium]
MRKILLFLFLSPIFIYAQGIDFAEDMNWEQIMMKAKAENKYILVDCSTSWCVPCRVMEENVFKVEEVGKVINADFVSLQLQFDIDTLKNPEKKSWHRLSQKFNNLYKISGFPTILFFDSDGNLLYQFTGMKNVPEFLKIVARVSNGELKYYALNKKYKERPDDMDNLYQLILLSKGLDETNVQHLLDEYLQHRKGVHSVKDAQLVYDVTNSSSNHSFKLLKEEEKAINSFLGEGVSNDLIRAIVYYEEAYYKLGNVSAQGYFIRDPNPDWNSLEIILHDKYPDLTEDLLAYIKLNFYQTGHYWDRFIPALSEYITHYGNTVSAEKRKEYATNVATYIDDKHLIEKTLNWSKQVLKDGLTAENYNTLAILYYKDGQTEEALNWMENTIKKDPDDKYKNNMTKMKAGENLTFKVPVSY